MKKCVFTILFFLGCFFMCLSTNTDNVSAVASAVVKTDAYDSRIINIEISGLSGRQTLIKVNEVETCEIGEEGCDSHTVASTNYDLRILASKSYEVTQGNNEEVLNYTITTAGDGNKYFLIECYYLSGGVLLPTEAANSCYFEHKLSTLTQRVVVNPDGNGKPSNVFDRVQYSSVRKMSISVDLLEEENSIYSGVIYVCENLDGTDESCGEYVADYKFDYYIASYGDGEKNINIYLVRSGNVITEGSATEIRNKSQLISKKVYLDTIGPKIEIEGGNWVFVEAGKTYKEQKATCKDELFENDTCTVTNDLAVVGVDYDSDKYQIITYEASDRLGNVTTMAVKVKVDTTSEGSGISTYLIVAGCVLVATGAIIGYLLIKSHEKKKKLSYI